LSPELHNSKEDVKGVREELEVFTNYFCLVSSRDMKKWAPH